ncbi:MAG: T9SS type A sorting domain-containing protein [Candidatus Azobacteroides sp.]|nr:T9SS type A sorting domain-containing protein [Candidatus Azobacteroides sp.]
MKKMITKAGLFLAAVLLAGNINAQTEAVIGSMTGNGLSLYPQRNGAAPGTPIAGVTFDFKMVTVGSKTWAWTNLTGQTVSADGWASQLRYWEPAKTEINLTGRANGNRQTFGSARLPNQNPVTVTFFQSWNNQFYETADFTYDYTQVNSADAADQTAPVLAVPTVVTQTAQQLNLSLSATDDSGNFFYYIEDAANNFAEVSFFNDVTLTLTPGVVYTFSVYAVDFSGNRSEVQTVSTEYVEPVYITEGTAQAISFKLDSRSLTELKIECTSDQFIGDAFVKLEINGVSLDPKEWKPTIDQTTGTKTYQIIVPAGDVPGWAKGAILALNLGYITMPIGDWGHYVIENSTITAGENTGAPILHEIGTGVDIDEPTLPPTYVCDGNDVLSGVSLSAGVLYYAPEWAASTNYTETWENGILTLHLGDATYESWQAQFPLACAMQSLAAGTTYFLSFDIQTTKDLPRVYLKVQRDGDPYNDFYIDIPSLNVSAGTRTVSGIFENTGGTTITAFDKILFDFGGNPADVDIVISNITICDNFKEQPTTAISATPLIQGISFSRDADAIYIFAEKGVASAKLFAVSGQTIASGVSEINTASLAKGIYILSVKDTSGNTASFKIAVK